MSIVKVYIRGNSFFLEYKGETDNEFLIATKLKKVDNNVYSILFGSQIKSPLKIKFSDLRDENDQPFSSTQVFEDWMYDNTGFNSASGGSGAGFLIPDSSTVPFTDNTARNTWAAANLGDLVKDTTVAQVSGTPNIWYLWTGESDPTTVDATKWIDATPLIKGEKGDSSPDNWRYASNEAQLISALESSTLDSPSIIVLVNRIALTTNTITMVGDATILGWGDAGGHFGELFLTDGESWTINGGNVIQIYANLEGDNNNSSDTFTLVSNNAAIIYARHIKFINTLNLNNVELRYEKSQSVNFVTSNSGDFINEYWDNTSTSPSIPNNVFFIDNAADVKNAIEANINSGDNKIAILTNTVVMDSVTINCVGTTTFIDTGNENHLLSLNANASITFSGPNTSRVEMFPPLDVSSADATHTTTLMGGINLDVRTITGGSKLQLGGTLKFRYEYIESTVELVDSQAQAGTITKTFWHNSNKEDLSSVSANQIPIKSANGLIFENSGIRKLQDGSLLAPTGFTVESASINFGDIAKLSEVSGGLSILDMDTGQQSSILTSKFNSTTGSQRPSFEVLEGSESEVVIQSNESTQITQLQNSLIINTPFTGQVNKIKLRVFGDMTNIRMRFTKILSTVTYKYLPTKASWETEIDGLNFTYDTNLGGVQDWEIDLKPSQVRVVGDEDFTLEILGDEINMMGSPNPANEFYLSVTGQTGHMTELAYIQRDIGVLASEGTFQAEVNTNLSIALNGSDALVLMPQDAINNDIVGLNQLNLIGSNTLTFIDTTNSFVFQRKDGTQVSDTEVVLNQSIKMQFIYDGGTWRFYDTF